MKSKVPTRVKKAAKGETKTNIKKPTYSPRKASNTKAPMPTMHNKPSTAKKTARTTNTASSQIASVVGHKRVLAPKAKVTTTGKRIAKK